MSAVDETDFTLKSKLMTALMVLQCLVQQEGSALLGDTFRPLEPEF